LALDIKDRTERFNSLPAHWILASILLLAAVVRIAALLSLKKTVYYDFLLLDEAVYHAWAVQIAQGTYQSTTVYEFAPLYPYLMAMVYKLFSPDIIYIRLLNIVFGTLSCALVFMIGKELADRRIGLMAALIACLYQPFIFYSVVPLKTAFAVFLFAGVIYFLVAIINHFSKAKALLLGVFIGLMLNVRPQGMILVPVLPLAILWIGYCRKASKKDTVITLVLYVTGCVIAVSPFVARNYAVAQKFALTTSQSGFNLYLANKPGGFGPVTFASTSPFEQGIHFTIEASKRAGKTLTPTEASAYWTSEIIKYAISRPGAFLKTLLQKTVYFFQQFQLTDHYCINFISRFVTFFKFPYFRGGFF